MQPARSKRRHKTPINFAPRITRTRSVKKRRGGQSSYVGLKVLLVVGIVLVVGGWIYRSTGNVLSESSQQPVNLTPPTQINDNFHNQVVACLLPIASFYGYHLDISSGFRTYAEEDAIYAKGRTTPGDIVSYVKGGRSTHNYGLAVDLVDDVYSYDIDWKRVGKIGAYCGLEHGDNGHEDLPHFQYQGGLTKDQLQKGAVPPKLVMPCALLQTRYDAGQMLSAADIKACGMPRF